MIEQGEAEVVGDGRPIAHDRPGRRLWRDRAAARLPAHGFRARRDEPDAVRGEPRWFCGRSRRLLPQHDRRGRADRGRPGGVGPSALKASRSGRRELVLQGGPNRRSPSDTIVGTRTRDRLDQHTGIPHRVVNAWTVLDGLDFTGFQGVPLPPCCHSAARLISRGGLSVSRAGGTLRHRGCGRSEGTRRSTRGRERRAPIFPLTPQLAYDRADDRQPRRRAVRAARTRRGAVRARGAHVGGRAQTERTNCPRLWRGRHRQDGHRPRVLRERRCGGRPVGPLRRPLNTSTAGSVRRDRRDGRAAARAAAPKRLHPVRGRDGAHTAARRRITDRRRVGGRAPGRRGHPRRAAGILGGRLADAARVAHPRDVPRRRARAAGTRSGSRSGELARRPARRSASGWRRSVADADGLGDGSRSTTSRGDELLPHDRAATRSTSRRPSRLRGRPGSRDRARRRSRAGRRA